MIEHVRRRASLVQGVRKVIVATCDPEIYDLVTSNGGQAAMTSLTHPTGSDRVAELASELKDTHIISLQGDEPLVMPEQINKIVSAINTEPHVAIWNAISPIQDKAELEDQSVVKCLKNKNGKLTTCFRKVPATTSQDNQIKFVSKVLGILAYRREALLSSVKEPDTEFSLFESIEQMKNIENDYEIRSVDFSTGYPGVNTKKDLDEVTAILRSNEIQYQLFHRIVN